MVKGKCFRCNGRGHFYYAGKCFKCKGNGYILLPDHSLYVDEPKKKLITE